MPAATEEQRIKHEARQDDLGDAAQAVLNALELPEGASALLVMADIGHTSIGPQVLTLNVPAYVNHLAASQALATAAAALAHEAGVCLRVTLDDLPVPVGDTPSLRTRRHPLESL